MLTLILACATLDPQPPTETDLAPPNVGDTAAPPLAVVPTLEVPAAASAVWSGTRSGGELLDVGDLDGDGAPEVLVRTRPEGGSDEIALVSGTAAQVALDAVPGRITDPAGLGRAVIVDGGQVWVTTTDRMVLVQADPATTVSTADPVATFTDSTAIDAPQSAADLDGDGTRDLVVYEPTDTVGEPSVVRLLLAPFSGDRTLAGATATLAGTDWLWSAGIATAAADLDGDGIAELVLGSGPTEGPGLAWVFDGPVRGAATTDDARATLTAEARDGAPYYASGVILHPVAAGDIDGDGAPEIALGDAAGGQAGPDPEGVVYVIAGDASGALDLGTQAGIRLTGDSSGDLAGRPLVAAGDPDGDGFDDLWVVAEGASGGTVYLLSGPLPPTGTLTDAASVRIAGELPDAIGETLRVADLDVDGRPDLLIGAPSSGEGEIFVLLAASLP